MFDLSFLSQLLSQPGMSESLSIGGAPATAPAGLFADQVMPDVTNPGMAVTSPLVAFNQDPLQIPSQLFPMPKASSSLGNIDPMQMAQLAGLFGREEPRPAPGAGIVRGQQYQPGNAWSYMRR